MADPNGRALLERGWVVIPDLVAPDAIASYRQRAIETYAAARRDHVMPPAGYDAMASHVAVVSAVSCVLNDARQNFAELLGAKPDRHKDTKWHVDPADDSRRLLAPGEPCAVVALWALDDFTHKNGPTEFVGGSHWRPRLSPEELAAAEFHAQQAIMGAGSVVVFVTSHIFHRAGACMTPIPERRLALRLNYAGTFTG